jgi:hopanoid C-3 methylase
MMMSQTLNPSQSIEVLLVSTFEGGFQPMTIASAITPLRKAGHAVSVLDTYVDGIQEELFKTPQLVAISVPLFDALHPGIEIANRVRQMNPQAHITFFGQYATINSTRLAGKYGDTCIAGEWEEPLVGLARYLTGTEPELKSIPGVVDIDQVVSGALIHPYMSRNHFDVPTRDLLPPLYKYPQIQVDKLCGGKQVVGATETARGCHHKCLYCSVFASYEGRVLQIYEDLVLQDVRNLVAEGMTHLTFIDADFFNTKQHGIKILRKLHAEFPSLTYDFTTRVDHILENKETLLEMQNLGVRFITSALEFPSELVLDAVAKYTTLEQIEEAVAFIRSTSIKLNPTFIMFNPWIQLEDIATFRAFVERNGLDEIIDPVQYETRLHLYKGSPLVNSPAMKSVNLIENEFNYEWHHDDPRVDELYSQSVTPVEEGVFKRCCLKC